MNVRITKEQKIKADDPADVYKIMQQILLRENKIRRNQEHFWIIGLNNAHKILFVELLCLGANNRVNIDPPEVFRMAIYKLASKAMFVHNHPSGEIRPGQKDINFTDHMLKAGKFLRIELLDHLIITEENYLSMQQQGIMDDLRTNGNYEIVKGEQDELLHFKTRMEAQRIIKGEKLDIAKKMLKDNEPISRIVKYTGLTEYQVEGLKKKVR
jgi:DNA repair protein RadC